MRHLVLHTDGGARGNPGPAAIGVVIEVEHDGRTERLEEIGEAIGVASNNVAEYRAIIRGLEEAERLGARRVSCLLDSLLVVEQLNGNYRVRSDDMKPLHARVNELRQRFALVTFEHVRRDQNQEADLLVNAALDGKPPGLLPSETPAEPGPGPGSGAIVQQASSAEWTPLARPGVRGVEGKVMVRSGDLTVAMLKFERDAGIDEHRGGGDTYVVCLEGEGHLSVGSTKARFSAGEWSHWPAGIDHRLWTTDTTMVTLMVEFEASRDPRQKRRG